MQFMVTEPGQRPYPCTMPVESVPFLIANGRLVVPCAGGDSRDYERYRELVNGVRGSHASSHGSLREMGA